MLRSLAAALLAVLVFAAPATANDDAAYWAYADRMHGRLDAFWDARAGYFKFGSGSNEPMANSMLLLTYATAAAHGHDGPARNDARARALAARLVASPPFVTRPGSAQPHAPGWVSSMNSSAGQHVVVDAEVVDGLVHAYRARVALRLPDSTVRAIRSAIHRTARGPFWRYPAIRLNQVNWYAQMYAADALVTGDPTLLRHDLAAQLRRFFRAAGANFGPGMRFHYMPQMSFGAPINLDSAEYANIVLSFTRFYGQARRAGMRPLDARARAVLRAWVRRALCGYWTHAGYLNWDTGLGFDRWHQSKKIGLAQEALIGLAATPSLLPDARWAAWAKAIFDRGLALYERLGERAPGGIPGPLLFDFNARPLGRGHALLGATRMLANAARAVDAGLGSRRGEEPPPLFAFDPDIGRLAVTTPAYNTAIVAVNRGAFPYGGLDLARLFDGSQEITANIGGRPPAAFGVLVRDRRGHRVAASQLPLASLAPLRLTHAPKGRLAGPFRELRATGSRVMHGVRIRVSHRFTPGWIETAWTVQGFASHTADVLFPSWGRGSITAVMRDGTRREVDRRAILVREIAYLYVRSEHSGYVVVPLRAPAAASVLALRVKPQSSAPRPGPTLAIQIARGSRFSRADLTVRLTPVHDQREAAAAAARLR